MSTVRSHGLTLLSLLQLAFSRYPKRGHALAETLPGEKVEQRVEAGVSGRQAERHHHGLLHASLIRTGVVRGYEVQVNGALYVVRHEADQKSKQDDDNHSDGLGACLTLTTCNIVTRHEDADDAHVADQDHQERHDETDHQSKIVHFF